MSTESENIISYMSNYGILKENVRNNILRGVHKPSIIRTSKVLRSILLEQILRGKQSEEVVWIKP